MRRDAALHSLRSVATDARGRGEVRLSQADVCLRRAEEQLWAVPFRAALFRYRLGMRRAVRHLWWIGSPTDLARREIAHVERGLQRLRRMADVLD